MSNHKFSLVTSILLLLLIAAAANMYFIYHAYNEAVRAQAQVSAQLVPGASRPNAFHSPPTSRIVTGVFINIDWYGDISLSRSKAGEYELSVVAYERGIRRPFPIESVEVDIRRQGEEKGFTPKLESSSPGIFKGPVKFPSPGTWEMRVRMHHQLQTLDFAKKFEIE